MTWTWMATSTQMNPPSTARRSNCAILAGNHPSRASITSPYQRWLDGGVFTFTDVAPGNYTVVETDALNKVGTNRSTPSA